MPRVVCQFGGYPAPESEHPRAPCAGRERKATRGIAERGEKMVGAGRGRLQRWRKAGSHPLMGTSNWSGRSGSNR
jgi:hypothetical protein